MRWLIVGGCVLALGVAAPMGSEAQAKRTKTCAVKMMDGKQTKWKCGAKAKCCYNWFMGKGMCVSESSVCL